MSTTVVGDSAKCSKSKTNSGEIRSSPSMVGSGDNSNDHQWILAEAETKLIMAYDL